MSKTDGIKLVAAVVHAKDRVIKAAERVADMVNSDLLPPHDHGAAAELCEAVEAMRAARKAAGVG